MASQTNPRYLAYCKAHGTDDPELMLVRDTDVYPGGKMCGFIIWNSARWSDWRTLRGYRHDRPLSQADHNDFDEWLNATVSQGA